MKNKGFYDYLDTKKEPEDQADRQLADLLAEVAQLEAAQPGQDYWNNFNSRLQQKLQQTPTRHRWSSLFQWPARVFSGLALAALLLFVFLPQTPQTQHNPGFEELNATQLSLLASALEDPYTYTSQSTETTDSEMNLAETDIDLLLDAYSRRETNIENFNAEEFIALWETEG